MIRRPPGSTLFPYPTLFRSDGLCRHTNRRRRTGNRRPGRHVPGDGDAGEQREPTDPRRLADGGPEPEQHGPQRTDRLRGLRRRGSRLRNAANLLYRLEWTAPRAEGHEFRGGNEPGHPGRSDRIGRILARGPPRDPRTRPRGVRVPRGPGPERLGRREELWIRPTEGAELLRDGGLGERRQPQPGGLDPEHGLLGPVRRVWRRGPRRLPGGGPPAVPRQLHLQALGRATGRTRDPRPPHLHLRAALSGPTFIFPMKWK